VLGAIVGLVGCCFSLCHNLLELWAGGWPPHDLLLNYQI